MNFDPLERVADAVLYEGYVLYPYRASSAKNQFRWQFGVVAPRAPEDADCEPWFSQTECLIERSNGANASAASRLFIRARFLRPEIVDTDPGQPSSWLRGTPGRMDLGPIGLAGLPLTRQARCRVDGVDLCVRVAAAAVGAADGLIKLQIRLENLETWQPAFAHSRDALLQHSLAGAHLLLGVEGASFVSLLEPPDSAAVAVADCQNRHTWPVLVGERSRRNLMLSSPIILYDYPAIAPESQGDLCDAAEIDEILSLRILTMTEDEKREARLTDPRARAIVDRIEAMTPEALTSLHGTMRSADFFNPAGIASPDQAFVMVGERRIEKGVAVRLRPNRRADAMDMFLRDQLATVAGVYRDVDERVYVAVTVDADPGATMHEAFGRFFYFDPSEVEPVEQRS